MLRIEIRSIWMISFDFLVELPVCKNVVFLQIGIKTWMNTLGAKWRSSIVMNPIVKKVTVVESKSKTIQRNANLS